MSEPSLEVLSAELRHLRELTDERFERRDEALKLQAQEIARRLEHLNNEAARALERDKSYLPRELYEANRKDFTEWRTKIDGFIASNSGRDKGVALMWAGAAVLIGIGLSIAGLSIAIYFK